MKIKNITGIILSALTLAACASQENRQENELRVITTPGATAFTEVTDVNPGGVTAETTTAETTVTSAQMSADDTAAVTFTTAETSRTAPSETTVTEAVTSAVTTVSAAPLPSPPSAYDTQAEVYDKLYLSQLIPKGAQLEGKDAPVDTSEVGNYRVAVSYVLDVILRKEDIYFSVTDTTPPVLLNAPGSVEIKTGSEFSLTDHMGAGDMYDDDIILTYTGSVDTAVPGPYPITVTASDSSGNTTHFSMTVNVVDELKPYVPPTGFIPFEDIIRDYSSMGSIGIDVSKWQGDIDFDRVKAAGCEFVFIRLGIDVGEITIDPYFEANIKNAKAAGLKVGVYFYSDANTTERIAAETAWIADTLSPYSLDLPVAYDWENFSNYQQYHMSIRHANDLYLLFDEQMRSYGHDTMLYSSKNFLENFWDTQRVPSERIWLAHYTSKTTYGGGYRMWQMCSDGNIDGIDGYVDVDIIMGT
jgi:GH25 family lysozyme M1 (1,4-beta-N-acetylmuramidase)